MFISIERIDLSQSVVDKFQIVDYNKIYFLCSDTLVRADYSSNHYIFRLRDMVAGCQNYVP